MLAKILHGAVIVLAAACLWAPLPPGVVERWYSLTLYPVIQHIVTPLTNLMPIRRHALHERDEAHDFAMAWVSVPDLGIHRSPQRYEHGRSGVVRFVSLDSDFTAELELDADGFVVRYPRLAERVAASA